MRKVKIITDSTADLPASILEECGIDMVPLHIILGEKNFLDDKSLSSEDLFRYADEYNTLPKTAAVNEYQFEEVFGKWLDQDYDVFFIGISSKLSATIQGAMAALERFDKERISIVDSLSMSTGLGLQVLEVSDMAGQGADLREITKSALALRGKVQASFVVDTLKYLYMGGRCSKLTSIVGSRLQIKPMLEVIDGEIVPGAKFRGSQYISKYFDQVMGKADKIDPKRIFITHCQARSAGDVKKRLEEEYGFLNVMITEASPTISTHCGPGTLGILFLYK
ncbi:MAG: DegV family protein [Eubacteriales bacterium]|nr:DegV family protein [Eubacteriales bacterium]